MNDATTINETIRKFGYPETLVAEYAHWVVLLRPTAVTLGSLVLAAKGAATAYGTLPIEAFTEQAAVVRTLETCLRTFVDFEKINYLMLMMVDPHVHYHVVPRYSFVRSFGNADYLDIGWPGLPDMSNARDLDALTIAQMVGFLRRAWPD